MRILVTGGLGGIGRVTVARLLRHGHDVLALDRIPEAEVEQEVWEEIEGAAYRQVDMRDFEALGSHFEGMDAVVHLAALPHPSMGSEVEVIDINCRGAFNVYRAAADAGIKRVVSASSINALGYNFGITFPVGQLQYFPIDEAHPEFTTDPYSFSKQMIEQIGAKTLFATHYHELTELENLLDGVKNFNVLVREWHDQIIFLHKIAQGGTDKSYGIHVGRLAGLPREVISRAGTILGELEQGFSRELKVSELAEKASKQSVDLFDQPGQLLLKELKELQVDKITPLQAMQILTEYQQRLSIAENEG